MSDAFDPSEVLRVLTQHGIDYIVVGGVAGTLAGSPLTTRDLDLVYGTSQENIEALAEALLRIGARYKDPLGRLFLPNPERLRSNRVNLLKTDFGDLDLLRSIGSDWTYEDLECRAVLYEVGDLQVRAIDLETLIEAKIIANRLKDKIAIPFLQEILRRQKLEPDE